MLRRSYAKVVKARKVPHRGWPWLIALSIATLWGGIPAQASFIEGRVASESGFDGAVTVVEERGDDHYGVVTVKTPYLDVYGKPRQGLARLVVVREAFEKGALPAFCHVHYEKDIAGARKWAARGWAVFTAVYTSAEEGHPIDPAVANGYNQARAIIQWARRLPFIDRQRLHIDGGSQGGYMALAMSAESFPVTSATPDAPVVNWAYNFNYFIANKPAMKLPVLWPESPLPIMAAVVGLAEASFAYFPEDLASDTWYHLSPISYAGRIANPTLVTCATGDMLVPMEAMTGDGLPPIDPARFPEGYQRDFDRLAPSDKTRKRFEECLPKGTVSIHRVPLQENSFELTLDMFQDAAKKPKRRPENMDKPWSKTHQWSLVYGEEGSPAPYASHTTYEWAMSPDSFVAYHQSAAPAPEILNAPKLARLIQRYTGELRSLPLLKDGSPANRLNFAPLERRDILQGLLDYMAMGEAHRLRLQRLYAESPQRPWGETLTRASLEAMLREEAPAP